MRCSTARFSACSVRSPCASDARRWCSRSVLTISICWLSAYFDSSSGSVKASPAATPSFEISMKNASEVPLPSPGRASAATAR